MKNSKSNGSGTAVSTLIAMADLAAVLQKCPTSKLNLCLVYLIRLRTFFSGYFSNSMQKLSLIILLFFFSFSSDAQEREIKKIELSFSWFKSYDTKYVINYNKSQFTAVCFDRFNKESFRKNYKFSTKDFEKFKKIINENIPEKDVQKSTSGLDGGGFKLTYFFTDGKSTKIIIRNPYRADSKYNAEFKFVHAFFDFAYSVIKDNEGIITLDNSFEPYFDGIPIRKVGEKPTEYKIWGTMSGNESNNKKFFDFLYNLPKGECIIVDTNENLSWALENDILVRFIIQNSNIKFANTSRLKYTREDIYKIRSEIKAAKKNNENIDHFNKNFSGSIYLADTLLMDKWLDQDNWDISIDELRINCH